jgi:acyl carrier protein
MVIDALFLSGWGYGLLQTAQNVGSYNILPYTRWQVSFLYIQFCHVPFQSGLSGTGFDDFRVDNLRLTRNFGQAYVTATRMNAGTVFDYGLAAADVESETVSTTASSANVTFSASMTGKLVSGDVICIARTSTSAGPDRNYLPSANALYWVGRVASVSGATVTMDEAVPNTASGCSWYFKPPWIEIQGGSSFVCDHMFLEGIHRAGMLVGNLSRFVCHDLKVSTGEYAGAMGAIVILNRLDGSVDVNVEDKAERTSLLKRFVVVPMLEDGGVKSSHIVIAKMATPMSALAPAGAGTLAAAPVDVPDWSQMAAAEIVDELRTRLRVILARELGMPAAAVDFDRPFPELGLDSMMAMTLLRDAKALVQMELSATMLWNHPTLTSFAQHVAGLMTPAPEPEAPPAEESTDDSFSVLDALFDSVESPTVEGTGFEGSLEGEAR